MHTAATALQSLSSALDTPPGQGVALGNWRWLVRQRMAGVRDLLTEETGSDHDGWLVARGDSVLRERNLLLSRLNDLAPRVLECAEAEQVRVELKRLVTDIAHHIQRLHDLAYDDVELELGGEE